MSILEAIVLGVVQGITEFLPISSTAHLRIVPALLGWEDPGAAYSAVIQLGTVAAVLLYFAKDLGQLTRGFLRGLIDGGGASLAALRAGRRPTVGLVTGKLLGTTEARLAWFVGLGTLPIGVAGLLFKTTIETTLRSLWVMSASLVLLALVLLVVERVASHRRTLAELTLRDGLIIGLWQALALIPGSSRSGTTITGGLALGLKREDAARYSFLLSIPATTLAGVFELKHLLSAMAAEGLVQGAGAASVASPAALVVGTVVSFGTGLLAIHGLLRFLRTRSMLVFIAYRLALGGALVALMVGGSLAP